MTLFFTLHSFAFPPPRLANARSQDLTSRQILGTFFTILWPFWDPKAESIETRPVISTGFSWCQVRKWLVVCYSAGEEKLSILFLAFQRLSFFFILENSMCACVRVIGREFKWQLARSKNKERWRPLVAILVGLSWSIWIIIFFGQIGHRCLLVKSTGQLFLAFCFALLDSKGFLVCLNQHQTTSFLNFELWASSRSIQLLLYSFPPCTRKHFQSHLQTFPLMSRCDIHLSTHKPASQPASKPTTHRPEHQTATVTILTEQKLITRKIFDARFSLSYFQCRHFQTFQVRCFSKNKKRNKAVPK